jgi:hypothetical protein
MSTVMGNTIAFSPDMEHVSLKLGSRVQNLG